MPCGRVVQVARVRAKNSRQMNTGIRACPSEVRGGKMAASLYIVVEGEDPGFDIFVNGHALARNEDALERLAARLGVSPLLEFFSADENSMALLLEQGGGNPEWMHHLPAPQWFKPTNGLTTVCTLLQFLEWAPTALGSETAQVLSELREYERVLMKTAQRDLRWHLAVSWR
jgi:hypothetical protein